MSVNYTRECILENIELAIRYETCGQCVNLGAALLAVVSESGAHSARYNKSLDSLVEKFETNTADEIKDISISNKQNVVSIKVVDKGVRVVVSCDEPLNRSLIKALDLFPVPAGSVI